MIRLDKLRSHCKNFTVVYLLLNIELDQQRIFHLDIYKEHNKGIRFLNHKSLHFKHKHRLNR